MNIWHHIGYNNTDRLSLDAELETLGIEVDKSPLPGDRSHVSTFDISEEDPHYAEVSSLIRYLGVVNIVETRFDEVEIRRAEWVRLVPSFERGYPQPEGSWLEKHPNLADVCPACGAGFHQVAPYRLSGEPQMGKHHFLRLFWTGVLLAKHEVIATLNAMHVRGYRLWDAVLHRGGTPSRVVAQIDPQVLTSSGLMDAEALNPHQCPRCGIVKYEYHARGYMRVRRSAMPDDLDIAQTWEWFGSGGKAFREILISNRVARTLLDEKWSGAKLKPVELI